MVESLQRSAGNAAVGQLLSGEPLPSGIRSAAERKLDADLSQVRLHTDATAADLAEGLGAEAVTVGQDVFMSPRPGGIHSSRGRKALIHELVHTVQATDSVAERGGVSSPSSAAEVEAASIGSNGFAGAPVRPAQPAPAGTIHRKVADEEEKAPQKEANLDFLGPMPEETSVGPKAGELGNNESIAWEIRVMQPLRGALSAVSETEWETALERMQGMGEAIWEYEQAYAKRDPGLAAELRGIRGWLALAATQIKGRFSGNTFTDQHIESLLKESLPDLEQIGKRLDSPAK